MATPERTSAIMSKRSLAAAPESASTAAPESASTAAPESASTAAPESASTAAPNNFEQQEQEFWWLANQVEAATSIQVKYITTYGKKPYIYEITLMELAAKEIANSRSGYKANMRDMNIILNTLFPHIPNKNTNDWATISHSIADPQLCFDALSSNIYNLVPHELQERMFKNFELLSKEENPCTEPSNSNGGEPKTSTDTSTH